MFAEQVRHYNNSHNIIIRSNSIIDHAIRCNMACLKNFGFICCARPGSSKDVNQVAKNRGYDKMFVNNRYRHLLYY